MIVNQCCPGKKEAGLNKGEKLNTGMEEGWEGGEEVTGPTAKADAPLKTCAFFFILDVHIV